MSSYSCSPKWDFLKEIPQALILNRWTKIATRKPISDGNDTLLEVCTKEKNKVQLGRLPGEVVLK